jgi:GNAT superfamily N-acetyltransferase
MLYQAIHVAEGNSPPPRSILGEPAIAHHLTEFGTREGDDAVIACVDGKAVGAAFCRRFADDDRSYGFVSTEIPEVGMAVLASHRGKGIGRALLMYLLERHPTMSLSVDADNRVARNLYESLGFVEVHPDGTSITMIRRP